MPLLSTASYGTMIDDEWIADMVQSCTLKV